MAALPQELRVEEGHARTCVLAKFGIQRCPKIYDNVIEHLGKGHFGSVALVELPSRRFAVKKIGKAQLAKDKSALLLLKNEIEAGMACDNPFVVKMYDYYEDKDNVCLVFELLIESLKSRFGQLLHGIPEDFARYYVAQAFLALNHLHSKGYTHNDVWIENFLLDKQGFLKLIDFGFAFKLEDFKDPIKRKEYIGIENSMPFRGWYYNRAPERIELKEYGPSSDFWALGLLTYRLAFAKEAFNAIPAKEKETEEEKIARWQKEETMILTADYEWPESAKVSDNMRNFISSLLVVDPKKRLGHANPDEIKNHVWFTSVNFDWEALVRKDVNCFREYLQVSEIPN
ncbi:protein kinase domain-containing protein [Ditylenchus destructor]|uniref:Serine/threonine-protein kinase greatwall n=1 Tax=Ditylenchus destructor TaxID=166010 RepID=A0AAD4QX97_9BILA|nr:protein kinase domain-containing protein [Ditylenchus destructor]